MPRSVLEAVEALSASCLPCELAAQTAEVDVTETPDDSVEWSGVLTYEGQRTGDGRVIETNALRWENLPIPLRWAGQDVGGHDGAVVVGRITEIERREDGAIFAVGDFDLGSEAGREAARQVEKGLTPGVSVDLDDVAFEVRVASDAGEFLSEEIEELAVEEPDEEGRVKVAAGRSDDELMITTDGRIRAATLVAIPAFESARITLTASAVEEYSDIDGDGDGVCNEGTSEERPCSPDDDFLEQVSQVGGPDDGAEMLPDQDPEFQQNLDALEQALDENGPTSEAPLDSSHFSWPNSRAWELILEGMSPEEALKQAIREGETGTINQMAAEKFNWVEETGTGHLPEYIHRIAEHLIEQGHSKSRAIAAAVNTVKRWAAGGTIRENGGPRVHPDTQAKAAAALAEWEAKKAETHANSAITAGGFPLQPPAEWFSDPQLSGPTPLKVGLDGRVYGHIAVWGTCHTGYPGQCVTPPQSSTGYAYFRTGSVYAADGSEHATGVITMDTLHAGKSLSAASTLAHYENTGRGAADVTVGEDAYGIWISGALRSTVTDEQARALRASPLSGDWRRIGGNLELVAALAVNVPGFPIPRPQGLVAGGAMQSLVASGMLAPEMADTRKARRTQRKALSEEDYAYLKRLADRERKIIEDEALALKLRVTNIDLARRVGLK